jgi:hypothetical protein
VAALWLNRFYCASSPQKYIVINYICETEELCYYNPNFISENLAEYCITCMQSRMSLLEVMLHTKYLIPSPMFTAHLNAESPVEAFNWHSFLSLVTYLRYAKAANLSHILLM